jgi:hypothetical protein
VSRCDALYSFPQCKQHESVLLSRNKACNFFMYLNRERKWPGVSLKNWGSKSGEITNNFETNLSFLSVMLSTSLQDGHHENNCRNLWGFARCSYTNLSVNSAVRRDTILSFKQSKSMGILERKMSVRIITTWPATLWCHRCGVSCTANIAQPACPSPESRPI